MRMAAAIHPADPFEFPLGGTADWRDDAGYGHLERAAPAAFAWEWLRRSDDYRSCYAAFARRSAAAPLPPCHWGLCAYADPSLDYGSAHPLWHRSVYPLVLRIAASTAIGGETVNLAHRVGVRVTLAQGKDGIEHCLFTGNGASLRFDLVEGSVTRGPFVPRFLLEGAAATGLLLPVLGQFLHMARTGDIRPIPSPGNWSRRRILELRVHDALVQGAALRDIAAELIDEDARVRGWRLELPSVRSRAQRLARAARAMEAGGWRGLLAGRRQGHRRARVPGNAMVDIPVAPVRLRQPSWSGLVEVEPGL